MYWQLFWRNPILYMAYRRTPIDFVKYELEINSYLPLLTGITLAMMRHNNPLGPGRIVWSLRLTVR